MEAKAKKEANDIRVGFRTRVSNVISYAEKLLKENNFRTLKFSAVGGSIGTLVNAVEILKYANPGLHQNNRIVTISYQSVEDDGKIQRQRLYPKLEVTLSLDQPSSKGEGYQEPMSEQLRKEINEIREKSKDRRPIRGGFRGRGRGGFRGRGRGFRGGRGRPPMRRGMGGRGRPPMTRGGPRRGGFRGAPRGAAPRGRRGSN